MLMATVHHQPFTIVYEIIRKVINIFIIIHYYFKRFSVRQRIIISLQLTSGYPSLPLGKYIFGLSFS